MPTPKPARKRTKKQEEAALVAKIARTLWKTDHLEGRSTVRSILAQLKRYRSIRRK